MTKFQLQKVKKMKNRENKFTKERVEELRKNINFLDIPEIKDFSSGHLRNCEPEKKTGDCSEEIRKKSTE